jgi:hypothetical protein
MLVLENEWYAVVVSRSSGPIAEVNEALLMDANTAEMPLQAGGFEELALPVPYS